MHGFLLGRRLGAAASGKAGAEGLQQGELGAGMPKLCAPATSPPRAWHQCPHTRWTRQP